MSDVTMADCFVVIGDESGPILVHRPMTPEDLDSLIRERGATDEMVWCVNHRLPRAGGIEDVCAIGYMPLYDPDIDQCQFTSVILLEAVFQARKEADRG